LNIYDTKVVACIICKKSIGEVEFDSMIIRPLCGQCVNPLPEGDKILYTISYYKSNPLNRIPQVS